MPNCFQLTRRSDLQAGPVILQRIDDEMREHFGCPADKDNYLGWYNYIGFGLAMGRTFERLRQDIDGHVLCSKEQRELDCWCDMRDMLDWLDANFIPDCFVEIGRR